MSATHVFSAAHGHSREDEAPPKSELTVFYRRPDTESCPSPGQGTCPVTTSARPLPGMKPAGPRRDVYEAKSRQFWLTLPLQSLTTAWL